MIDAFDRRDRRHRNIRSKAATARLETTVAQSLNEVTQRQRLRMIELADRGWSYRRIERLTGHRRETISRYVRKERERGGARFNSSKMTISKRTRSCARRSR